MEGMIPIARGAWRRTCVLAVAWCLVLATAAGAEPLRPEHLVVISVDGLRPGVYTQERGEGLRLPAIDRLRRRGAYARGVTGVWPTTTYPSHTTLITGRYPASHGVTGNHVFDREHGPQLEWRWFEQYRHGPSLIEAAHAAGGTVASIMWPVTVNGAADWQVAEIWHPGNPDSWDLVRLYSTPELLARTAQRNRFNISFFFRRLWQAYNVAQYAATAIWEHRPTLTLVHLLETDSFEHAFGPGSPEAREAFERTDAAVAAILRAIDHAGLMPRTAVAVVGDHGFAEAHTAINVPAILEAAGVRTARAARAAPNGRAWTVGVDLHGGSADVILRDPKDTDGRRAAVRALEEAAAAYPGTFRVVPRAELDALHAAPDAAVGLAATPGFKFGTRWHGQVRSPAVRQGEHGYPPTEPTMRTGLILAGPGVRRGAVVSEARLVDVGPTLAALMGWTLAEAQGVPMTSLFVPRLARARLAPSAS